MLNTYGYRHILANLPPSRREILSEIAYGKSGSRHRRTPDSGVRFGVRALAAQRHHSTHGVRDLRPSGQPCRAGAGRPRHRKRARARPGRAHPDSGALYGCCPNQPERPSPRLPPSAALAGDWLAAHDRAWNAPGGSALRLPGVLGSGRGGCHPGSYRRGARPNGRQQPKGTGPDPTGAQCRKRLKRRPCTPDSFSYSWRWLAPRKTPNLDSG